MEKYERGEDMAGYPATCRQGSRGAAVRFLQQRIHERGRIAGVPLAVDGIFGENTHRAVKQLQAQKGQRADGIAGPKTWELLLNPACEFRQGDARWGKLPYTAAGDAKQTIASSGCGPVAMAMAISGLCAKGVLPPELCSFALRRGHRTANNGTGWGFFHDAAAAYGLACTQTGSLYAAEQALAAGGLCIANVGPGMFTRAGHYILLRDQNPFDGEIYVLDPASALRNRAPRSIILNQTKQFFILIQNSRA